MKIPTLLCAVFLCLTVKRFSALSKKADGLKRTGEDARKDYYEHMFMYGERGIQGAAWFKLYKTDIIRKNGIEFPKLRKSEDDVFVARYVNCIDVFI